MEKGKQHCTHKMQLKLFSRKRRNLNAYLRQNDQITALSGFGSTIIVGTQMGCLHIIDVSKPHLWQEQANIQLSEEKNSKAPISQICCASALSLVFLIYGNELIALILDSELTLINLLNKVKRISLNSHPAMDNPFDVHIAVAHSQKQQILVGKLSDDANHFRKEQTLSTVGRVMELAFSGQCICYANDCGAYFVHNIQEKSGIHLFDASAPEITRVICNFGMEEFMLADIHKLLMFVNGHGASTHAPILLPGEHGAAGLTLKEPFIYFLDNSGMLFIFSTMDHQLKQCLSFHSDQEDSQLPHHQQITYQIANIDGQLFVFSSFGDFLFEIVPMAILSQIDEHIQLDRLDDAIDMLERNYAEICTSTDEQEILQLHQMQQKIAFLFLHKGKFAKAINLLVNNESDPQLMVFKLIEQHDQKLCLRNDIDNCNERLSVFQKSLVNENTAQIPLEIFVQYFEVIYNQQWAFDHIELIENILARIYFYLEEYNKAFDYLIRAKIWNNSRFRKWLANTKTPINLNHAAKLAANVDCYEEAFNIWKQMVDDYQINSNELLDCFQALFRVKSGNLMASHALPWLISIDPVTCMNAVENLEDVEPEQRVQPEIVVQLFERMDQKHDLLFNYLCKRIFALDSSSLHNKLLSLYVRKIMESENNMQEQQVYRKKLQHFLLFSNYYDHELAQELLHNSSENHDMFRIETLLTMANEDTALHCLNKLIRDIEEKTADLHGDDKSRNDYDETLSVAGLLCTRYPSMEMVKTMLNAHLRFSRKFQTFRIYIPRILSMLDNDADAIEVLQNLPEDFDSPLLVQNFLNRHIASCVNKRQWQQIHERLAPLERQRLEAKLASRLGKTHFKQDEHSRCSICQKTLLAGQEFIRYQKSGVLAHLRCHLLRKEHIF